MKRAASTANLIYVNDQTQGISRIKRGKGFAYPIQEQIVDDQKNLEKIKKAGHSLPSAYLQLTNRYKIFTDEVLSDPIRRIPLERISQGKDS